MRPLGALAPALVLIHGVHAGAVTPTAFEDEGYTLGRTPRVTVWPPVVTALGLVMAWLPPTSLERVTPRRSAAERPVAARRTTLAVRLTRCTGLRAAG